MKGWQGPPPEWNEQDPSHGAGDWRARRWRHAGPPWVRNRRFMFLRFLFFFGAMLFLFLGALGVILLIVQAFNPNWQQLGGVALALCAVPLVFVTLASILGGLAARRLAYPIADVMSAADAVAQGDLSVRLREQGRGEFRQLAHRFNNMTAELERAEQQRRNLTADIAHELRNPLHIIQGNLEAMLDGVYEPTPDNLTATLDETRLLARLVSDLQTLSLAESGQLPLHLTRVLAADLLADVAAAFAPRAAEEGIDLRVDVPAEAAALELTADPDRLEQVLSNLVVNALHYTPSGGTISLRAASTPGGVQLTVSDTGVGIPPDDLPYIFDRFWRGDRSRSRAGGSGSGLGLAIAKQLVRAHGGTISATSRLGGGTEIAIELPVEESPASN